MRAVPGKGRAIIGTVAHTCTHHVTVREIAWRWIDRRRRTGSHAWRTPRNGKSAITARRARILQGVTTQPDVCAALAQARARQHRNALTPWRAGASFAACFATRCCGRNCSATQPVGAGGTIGRDSTMSGHALNSSTARRRGRACSALAMQPHRLPRRAAAFPVVTRIPRLRAHRQIRAAMHKESSST